jgi:hypothetical protein
MTEEQRAAEAAANNPKSEPELNPPYPDAEPGDGRGVPLADYVMNNEVMDYFNIGPGPRQNVDVKEQMSAIIEWAKQNADAQGVEGILRAIRHAETMLGSRLKSDRVQRLHRYIRIQQQKSLLAEKGRALYA